jgi:hypothetical protein
MAAGSDPILRREMMHVRVSERPCCVAELGNETTAVAVVEVDGGVVAAKTCVSQAQTEGRWYALGALMVTGASAVDVRSGDGALADLRPGGDAGDSGLLRSRFGVLGERLLIFFFKVFSGSGMFPMSVQARSQRRCGRGVRRGWHQAPAVVARLCSATGEADRLIWGIACRLQAASAVVPKLDSLASFPARDPPYFCDLIYGSSCSWIPGSTWELLSPTLIFTRHHARTPP